MYGNEPVMIPDKPGKISIRTKNGSGYIRYLVRRDMIPTGNTIFRNGKSSGYGFRPFRG